MSKIGPYHVWTLGGRCAVMQGNRHIREGRELTLEKARQICDQMNREWTESLAKTAFDAGWNAALGEAVALVRSESFQPFRNVDEAVTSMDELVAALEQLATPAERPGCATPPAATLATADAGEGC